MSSQRTNFTTPVGRIVMGSLYKPNTKDAEGKPLITKNGANAGQPRSDFFFALAIPKAGESHWSQTAWGAILRAAGSAAFPQASQSPTFAWKVDDGDSQVPNKRGRKPIDNEGWQGNWILKFSGGYAPKIYRFEGTAPVQVLEENYVKPGHFVEVAASVDGNGSQSNPGIYLNHSMVCFRAYGPEIFFGADAGEAGFGQAALPAGATLTPPASANPMPAAASAPGAYAAVSQPSVAAGAAAPPIPVTPNPQFLQVPSHAPAVLAPAFTPAPPASPSRTMTAKAAGATYQAFVTAGWTDENLITQGYMS